ncbi:hypothetical protein IWQ60_012106 [Tieghemiomyces parasiticus]|uniref:Extracellular membrane protein CFEM domain-containing protein n=1 Tax=Tieghemiomyces parasiticus TaxID=78921 RepID=A0A9W7ZIH1_9FUNG|nr:hypothetical protein IWQ60_012106 [Tieghemiomyces parasiticus]
MQFSAALIATVAVLASTAVQADLTSAQVECLQSKSCTDNPSSCLTKCFNVSNQQLEVVTNCFADCRVNNYDTECSQGCTDMAEQFLGASLDDINSILDETLAASDSSSSSESDTATVSASKSASATSSAQSSRATSASSSASSVSAQSKSASATKSATASNTLDSFDDSDSAAPSLSVAAATLFSLSAAAALAVLY